MKNNELKEVLCPSCNSEMELYGVFDSGERKFCCVLCHRMLSKPEVIQCMKVIKN